MLQTSERTDCKRKASVIASMEHSQFDAYFIEKVSNRLINVIGVDGRRYAVDRDSMGITFGEMPSTINVLIGMFARYKGVWQVNGMVTAISTKLKYEEANKEYKESVDGHNRAIEYFENHVAENQGRRIYYFDGTSALKKWLKEDIKINNINEFLRNMPNGLKEDRRIFAYIPTDGDIEFASYLIEAIKDPNNPYYDEKICHEDGMQLIDDGYCFRSECFHYMIDHGMLSEVRFADNDEERGHRVYQQNIDFIARFMRRADY